MTRGFIPRREELAWGAGFWDGEGCCSARLRPEVSGGDYIQVTLDLGQHGRRPLDRFHAAVGGIGSVAGPRAAGRAGLVRYDWQAGGFETVQAVIAMLWPFLCEPKREQAAAALTAYHRSWLARTERRNFCVQGHDKRVTGRFQSGGCKECSRRGYWRSRALGGARRPELGPPR